MVRNRGGGNALVRFSIGGTTYQAEEGMTWSEWCASSYNTDEYYIDGDEVYRRVDGDNLYRVMASADETIIANYTYREKMA